MPQEKTPVKEKEQSQSPWVQTASSRLQETKPEMFKAMSKAKTLDSYLKGMAGDLESLATTQERVFLVKGLPPEQARAEAETLALDTYLPFPGSET